MANDLQYDQTVVVLVLQQSECGESQHADGRRTLDDLRQVVYEGLCNLALNAWTLQPNSDSPSKLAAGSTSKPSKQPAKLAKTPPLPLALHQPPTAQPLRRASALVHDPTTNQVWNVRSTQPAISSTPLTVHSTRIREIRAASEGIALRHARLLTLSPTISEVTSRTFAPLTWVRSWRTSRPSQPYCTGADASPTTANVHAVVPDAHLGMSAAEQVTCCSLALP